MRHLATAIRLAGWAVVAALGVLAVDRSVAWDARYPLLLGIHGLGPLPYLAAVPVACVALARRHVRLGLVALTVAAVILPTGLPEVMARSGIPREDQAGPRVRILSWNLYQGNTDAAAIDSVIRQADADVVVLQELSVTNLPAILGSPALATYPHTFSSPRLSAFGSGIWSRLPLEDARDFDVGGLPMTRAVVSTPAGPVRLINVHTLSPVSQAGLDLWPRQMDILADEVRRPGSPIVLAGDFNATWGHRPFRRLLDTGLDDAAAARGQPWTATWPVGGRFLRRPALRLDHVLTGPGLRATSYATGGAGGSDHRSIVADIAVDAAQP